MLTSSQALSFVASQNSRRKPDIPDFIKERMSDPSVYVYNVYAGTGWTRSIGSLGMYFIPKCEGTGSHPSGWEKYSKPLIIPPVVIEYIDIGEGQLRVEGVSGRSVAKDIVHDGGQVDLAPWGVFIAAGKTPTAEELSAAREALTKTMAALLDEADRLWNGSSDDRARVGAHHKNAAAYLGVKRTWLTNTQAMSECPFCYEPVRPSTVICPHCKQILDKARWLEGQADFILANATAATAPASKPAKASTNS
jgi:hypothetical protein